MKYQVTKIPQILGNTSFPTVSLPKTKQIPAESIVMEIHRKTLNNSLLEVMQENVACVYIYKHELK